METHKRATALPVAILIVIAYVAAFPNRADRELVVRAAWSTSLDRATTGGDDTPHAFRVGDRYGYVDAGGALTRLESVFYDVTMGDRMYSNYSKGATGVVIRRQDGGIAGSIGEPGWPLIPAQSTDTVYLFSTDLLSVAEATLDGSVRWRREMGSLITCFSHVPQGTLRAVVGTVDGSVHLIAADGSEMQTLEPPLSRVSATYGCGATVDGRMVAVVQGLGPQTLVGLGAVGGSDDREPVTGYRVLWSRAMEHESREEIVVRFTADGRFLVVDAGQGVDVYDSRSGRASRVRTTGYLEETVSAGRVVVFATRDSAGGTELVVLVPPDIVVARVRIPALGEDAEIRHLSGHDGYFLLGARDAVTRLDTIRI